MTSLRFFEAIIFILVMFRFVGARVMEKTELACNGPCGRMSLTCPPGHTIAVRDAVYRVQERSDACTSFTGCGDSDEDVCCDPTPQDCIFAFSPSHLRAVQKNCSHVPGCELQTERSEVESVQCSASEPASQTLVNYVCVNESVVTDICSTQERVVQGKTLFALLNPQGPARPHRGSVCTCLAESTKWPTTNSIAAFIVDMRLNRVDSEQCANASMTVRSGSNQKTLTCATSRDPRVNFPFVAVLNDSNVASLRLQLDRHLPEFVWVGFEANEDEDIRLSCKLQGVQPTGPANRNTPAPKPGGNIDVTPEARNPSGNGKGKRGGKEPTSENSSKKEDKLPLPAILGGATAGLIVVVVLIIIFVAFKRKWKTAEGLPEIDENESDLDIYYSTTADELGKREFAMSEKRPSRGSTDSKQELYITADQVRANKRTNNSKRVRIISTPDIVEDLGPEQYVSQAQIRENKRMSQKKKQSALKNKDLANQLTETSTAEEPLPFAESALDCKDDDDHYDRLHRTQKNMAAILESYDQLEPSKDAGQQQTYSSAEVQRSESTRPLVRNTGETGKLDRGNENLAYEDTEMKEMRGEAKSQFRITSNPSRNTAEDRGVYFELEMDSAARNSTTSVSSISSGSHRYSSKASAPPQDTTLAYNKGAEQTKTVHMAEPTTLPIRGVSRETLCESLAFGCDHAAEDGEEEEIYNDGKSDFAPSQLRLSTPGTDSHITSSKPKKRTRASVAITEPSTPVAAPRRKASLGPMPTSSNYDFAKPIP